MDLPDEPFIFTMPKKMRPTFPNDMFKPGDLIIAYKINTIQYAKVMLDLQKKQDQKIIDSMPNEIHGINE